jgi:hypothetical protein
MIAKEYRPSQLDAGTLHLKTSKLEYWGHWIIGFHAEGLLI